MRFISFKISNFRGIQEAKIDLLPQGAGISTLIGLNESGKTTVLEAISTFQRYGGDEKSLYQSEPSQIDATSFVPKHEKATFTGAITVAAEVEFEGPDRAHCIAYVKKESDVKIDPSSIPDRIIITRGYRFENGDEVETINDWSVNVMGVAKGKRKSSPSLRTSQHGERFLHWLRCIFRKLFTFRRFCSNSRRR